MSTWEWFQLIEVADDHISRLEDFPAKEAALAAAS